MPGLDLFQEADRQLVICNACRYCEGYCPVFRAIEIRRQFDRGDVFYLANLCHDCRACYYACMFTPPHDFAINLPKILAEARIETYERMSWPGFLGRAFKNRGVTFSLIVAAIGAVAVLALMMIPLDTLLAVHSGPGAFYEVVPHAGMVGGALLLSFYAIVIWMRGGMKFWAATRSAIQRPGGIKTLAFAVGAALGLRYLTGGGPGCFYPDERPTSIRRVYHALTFWGFVLDFISTTLAFVYEDFLHHLPPYPVLSLPVLFGTVGGVALVIGTSGLISLKTKSDSAPAGDKMTWMDFVFLFSLWLVALTGLATLILRNTSAMGSILVLHLACVAVLFLSAPYGKFVHAVYRTLALTRYEVEQTSAHQHVGH
jgi:citrate/tricarballylate utilization protein